MAYATKRLRENARAMRRAPTRAEDRLWNCLRDRRFSNLKFRRQVPVGRYVVDFYCAAAKLVIEIDGSQHQDRWIAEADERRSRALRARGLTVLRISNELVIRDPARVWEWIRLATVQLMPAE